MRGSGDALVGLLVTYVMKSTCTVSALAGYFWLAGMVRGFPVKDWGGLFVGGDVVDHCVYCHLGLGLISILSSM